MTRCRHCLTPMTIDRDCCRVCGIKRATGKIHLSPDDRKVRRYARCVRVIAMLHLVGAAFAVMVATVIPGLTAAGGVLALINLMLAFGLSAYAYWAYTLSVVYYFLIGMVNIVSVNIPGILLILILLYAVGNGTSKSLFERRLSVSEPSSRTS